MLYIILRVTLIIILLYAIKQIFDVPKILSKIKINKRKKEMSFEKFKGIEELKEQEEKEGFITNCFNCRAETMQIEFGKCKYCGNLIFSIRYNWILDKIETI